jgi:hypothetical protein
MSKTYIKQLLILGGPLGLASAQVTEERIDDHGAVSRVGTRALQTSDDVLNLSSIGLAATLETLEQKYAEIEALTLRRDELDARISELEAELALAQGQPVPSSARTVTMAQARVALAQAGITEKMVEDKIAAIPDPAQRFAAEKAWEYSPYITEGSKFVTQLAGMLGIDAAAVTALFDAAEAEIF